LVLLLIGLAFGGLAYWLITNEGTNPLILVPSVVAATTGAIHIFKRQAPRESESRQQRVKP
jgi:hypothetical protein